MDKHLLIKNIEKVEQIASASKFKRMLMHPFKYISAILFREVIYKRGKIEREVKTRTFFDTEIHVLLPSGTDIYITGGKSHDSEIRLAKFIIHKLKHSDVFVDIGAHYGYFSLLASKLVGEKGKVYSYEASPVTYRVLCKNTRNKSNIKSFNLAVSDEDAELIFHEFPNLYSEYNTLFVDQFKNEIWFSTYKPKEVKVKSIILDSILSDRKIFPKIFKIDVEGAEYKVILGIRRYLTENAPYVVMEYWSKEKPNMEHQKAEKNLKSLGYLPFAIDKSGKLKKLDSISNYLELNKLESDNIVFLKEENAQ